MLRTLCARMLGGLVILVGFAGAANADATVSLIWQATGNNRIVNPPESANLVLDVMLHGGTAGSFGGGITVDYGNTGKLTFVSAINNPDAAFQSSVGTPTNTGTQVRNINGVNPFGPVAINSSVRIGSILFHKELNPFPLTLHLTTLYTATDGINNLVGDPGDFGTATLKNTGNPATPTPTPPATPTPPTPTPPTDIDDDGIPNTVDNCINSINPSQDDTDDDDCGNICDADFDQNGIVGFSDILKVIDVFGTVSPLHKTNEPVTNVVGLPDIILPIGWFGNVPGHTGTTMGTTVCP